MRAGGGTVEVVQRVSQPPGKMRGQLCSNHPERSLELADVIDPAAQRQRFFLGEIPSGLCTTVLRISRTATGNARNTP